MNGLSGVQDSSLLLLRVDRGQASYWLSLRTSPECRCQTCYFLSGIDLDQASYKQRPSWMQVSNLLCLSIETKIKSPTNQRHPRSWSGNSPLGHRASCHILYDLCTKAYRQWTWRYINRQKPTVFLLKITPSTNFLLSILTSTIQPFHTNPHHAILQNPRRSRPARFHGPRCPRGPGEHRPRSARLQVEKLRRMPWERPVLCFLQQWRWYWCLLRRLVCLTLFHDPSLSCDSE